MSTYDLPVSSLKDENIDPKSVVDFLNKLQEKGIKLHNFVMARNGKIVADVSVFPYSTKHRHIINSCTKTFTSIAIGILYDRGLLKLDDKVKKYFNNPSIDRNGYSDLTIFNLLTMSLGQDGPDMYACNGDGYDWCERVFDRHVSDAIGDKFLYNSMASHLLSAIVTKITGQSEEEFLRENFFEYCGIKDIYWAKDPSGYSIGGAGIYVAAKDLIKIGELYRNEGVINGKRILSKEWCLKATSKQIETAGSYSANKTESTKGYGFQIWMCSQNGFRASGLFGQLCFVFKDKGITCAVNSSSSGSQGIMDAFFDTIYKSIDNYEECQNFDEKLHAILEELSTKPLKGSYVPAYQDLINDKELKYRGKNKSIKLSFAGDLCSMTVRSEDNKYSCLLKRNDFVESVSDIDNYLIPLSSYQQYTKRRDDVFAPITYGSYAWVGATHLKIMVLFKDHTSYNYWDIYLDDKYGRIDECFTYLIEGYDYRNQDILLMP